MLAKFCTFLQRSMTSYPKETFRKKLQNVTLCTLGTRSLIKPYPSGLELSGSLICIKVFSKLISFFKRKVHAVISSWKYEINYNFCLTVLAPNIWQTQLWSARSKLNMWQKIIWLAHEGSTTCLGLVWYTSWNKMWQKPELNSNSYGSSRQKWGKNLQKCTQIKLAYQWR